MKTLSIRPTSEAASGWGRGLRELAEGAAYQQHWSYGEIAAARGRRVQRLEIWDGAERIGLAQLIGRSGVWLLGRGPVLRPDVEGAMRRRCLRALACALRGGLIATPERPCAGWGLVPLITPRHQAIWDLAPPPDALRAGLAGKWRNRLVRAEGSGLDLRHEPTWDWLAAAEAEQRHRRGYRGLDAGFIAAWERLCPGGVLTLSARHGGRRVAGVLFLRHGAGASYHLGWTAPEGRRLNAHTALLWRAALGLQAEGVRSLDLGDVNSESGAGLMRFKLGTGAVAHPLGATCLVLPG